MLKDRHNEWSFMQHQRNILTTSCSHIRESQSTQYNPIYGSNNINIWWPHYTGIKWLNWQSTCNTFTITLKTFRTRAKKDLSATWPIEPASSKEENTFERVYKGWFQLSTYFTCIWLAPSRLLLFVSGQETIAGDLVRHLLPALPLNALLSLILIGDLETTEDESAPAYSRTSSLRKQPFLLVPRWGETTVFAGYGTSMCDYFLWATTYPNWNFPSESLQFQLVNDHLS